MSPRLTPIRLALLRQERSQKWLADRIGKSEPVMSRIVNGLVPDLATREAIAKALDRPVSELFPVHGPEDSPTAASADETERQAA